MTEIQWGVRHPKGHVTISQTEGKAEGLYNALQQQKLGGERVCRTLRDWRPVEEPEAIYLLFRGSRDALVGKFIRSFYTLDGALAYLNTDPLEHDPADPFVHGRFVPDEKGSFAGLYGVDRESLLRKKTEAGCTLPFYVLQDEVLP